MVWAALTFIPVFSRYVTVLCLSGAAAARIILHLLVEVTGARANIARRFSSETVSYSIYLPQTTTKKEDTRGEHDAPNDLDFLGRKRRVDRKRRRKELEHGRHRESTIKAVSTPCPPPPFHFNRAVEATRV